MPRPPTGSVAERTADNGRVSRALRFNAYGKRRFVNLGAVSVEEAHRELRHVLADVERGQWQPTVAQSPAACTAAPTFHEYVEQWWLQNAAHLAEKTQTDYRWRIEAHLLPWFADLPLDQITIDSVDRYKVSKLNEDRPLAASSINKTMAMLEAILETAGERELIGRNPAHGKRRRLKEARPSRSYLDSAEQIEAVLDAASELDREALAHHQHLQRRAIVATLLFTGLRIGELTALRWRDVDLANGRLIVQGTKTAAAVREITMLPVLRDELLQVKATTPFGEPDDYVFPTRPGKQQSQDNLRKRVVDPAVSRARAAVLGTGGVFPDRLTPHGMRRTFASLLFAIGEDVAVVMLELGHADPKMTLGIYAHAMRRGDEQRNRLRNLLGVESLGTEKAQESTFSARSLQRARP